MRFALKTARISAFCQTSAAALAVTGALVSPALGGAFTQQAGKGQIIATATITDSSRYFDAKGNVVRGPGYAKTELPVLVEYGITDWLTAMATPTYLHAQTQGSTFSGLEYAEFGARVRLYSTPDSAFAIQATTRPPGPRDKADPAQAGYTDLENDVRALYARSFKMGSWDSFANFEAGYRSRNGAPPDEWHFDATLGFRPKPDLLILVQSNVVPTASTAALPRRNTPRQLSAVSMHCNGRPGGRITTVAGENQIIQPGAVAGLWCRF
jgi:hypothetical protein